MLSPYVYGYIEIQGWSIIQNLDVMAIPNYRERKLQFKISWKPC